jgi:hypothetical protein
MGDVYKVNLTWTSVSRTLLLLLTRLFQPASAQLTLYILPLQPLVTYEPSGAWRQAATMYNDSTATFSFYGE